MSFRLDEEQLRLLRDDGDGAAAAVPRPRRPEPEPEPEPEPGLRARGAEKSEVRAREEERRSWLRTPRGRTPVYRRSGDLSILPVRILGWLLGLPVLIWEELRRFWREQPTVVRMGYLSAELRRLNVRGETGLMHEEFRRLIGLHERLAGCAFGLRWELVSQDLLEEADRLQEVLDELPEEISVRHGLLRCAYAQRDGMNRRHGYGAEFQPWKGDHRYTRRGLARVYFRHPPARWGWRVRSEG